MKPSPHPGHMLAKGFGQVVVQREVDAPGEQQVVEGRHQPQAIVMAEGGCHQGEIDVGTGAVAPHGTGAIQQDVFDSGLGPQHGQQACRGFRCQPRDDSLRDKGRLSHRAPPPRLP